MVVELRGNVVPPDSMPVNCDTSVKSCLTEGSVDLIEPFDFVVVEWDASCSCGAEIAAAVGGQLGSEKWFRTGGERTVRSGFASG